MEHTRLPYVDEHAIDINAQPEDVWWALLEVIEQSFSGPAQSALAGALGCADRKPAGPRPLSQDATIPGFRVTAAREPQLLLLTGRHRFSNYALILRIEGSVRGARLRAETRAAFPGLRGRLYRSLVIGTRAHVLLLRAMFAVIKRRAERPAR